MPYDSVPRGRWTLTKSSTVDPEGASFVWADGRRAALGLHLERSRPRRLELELWPFQVAGRRQEVAVRLNGSLLGRRPLEGGRQVVELAVPGERWRTGENLLVFDFAYAVAPAAVDPSSGDRRSLAVAFDRLSLR